MSFTKINNLRAAGISTLLILFLTLVPQAFAEEADEEQFVEEIIVTGSLNTLPTEEVGSVFGFDKNLLETPRSASTISSEQMERFGMSDIDDLVALAPGTFTQSFFGVAGGLDVRGTPGETYFRGVRRLDNPGNYPTPIGASDRIDIVRGPATPIYGPSKIGGYLNFVPKSARADSGQYLAENEGKISYTTGSWDQNVITAEAGGPGRIGDQDFGFYLYSMIEDSGSYYDNSGTDQTLLQASFDVDMNEKLRIQFGGMYHKYEGNQVAGWNRLTQALIDDGTYLTGDAQPLDLDGDGSISHAEYGNTLDFDDTDGDGAFGIAPFVFRPEFVTVGDLDSLAALVNVGTAKLKGSQTLVAADDTLENEVYTFYFDIIYQADNGWEIKNQLFYEGYENLNENAYGFSQFHDSWVVEDKIILSKVFESGSLTTSVQLSPSIRYTDFKHGDDYTNEYFDRRDLTGPSTALDRRLLSTRIDADYTEYYVGDYTDIGIAAMVDFTWESGLSILLGARWDTIDISSEIPLDKIMMFNFTSGFVLLSDDGQFLLNDFVDTANFGPGDIQAPVKDSSTEDGISWTASISWKTPIGIIPYVTASEQSTLIAGQGAEVTTGNVFSGGSFDSSELIEFGVKGSFLEDSLYIALSFYEQERTDFSAQSIVTNQTNRTKGAEAEVRWVVNEHLIVTAGYSNVKVTNLDTLENGGRFSFYGAEDIPQIDPSLVYGGQVIGVPAALTKRDARRAGMPENILSFTGTYAFDNGLAINASVVSVDSVYSGYSRVVKLPSYTLLNMGVIYETEQWAFSFTAKNLTNEDYYRANFPNLFGSQIVLPELPRHYQASIAYHF